MSSSTGSYEKQTPSKMKYAAFDIKLYESVRDMISKSGQNFNDHIVFLLYQLAKKLNKEKNQNLIEYQLLKLKNVLEVLSKPDPEILYQKQNMEDAGNEISLLMLILIRYILQTGISAEITIQFLKQAFKQKHGNLKNFLIILEECIRPLKNINGKKPIDSGTKITQDGSRLKEMDFIKFRGGKEEFEYFTEKVKEIFPKHSTAISASSSETII